VTVLVFSASDKGGTGRSVTSANLAYHRSLDGSDVCFLDFDFGSPTAATVFDLPDALSQADGAGLHAYLRGEVGRLVLVPGDRSGGEFVTGEAQLHRCVDLILSLKREFDVIVVDLSAGRSYAVDLVLNATSPSGGLGRLKHRWLVFHRWTRQHVTAAAELAFGTRGIVRAGVARGHDEDALRNAIRFVRAAVPDLASPLWSQTTPARYAWMLRCDERLEELASGRGIGRSRVLASIPLEPVLQWQERLITDEDVHDRRIAEQATWQAMGDLAHRVTDDSFWEAR
jgi:hypothetical protein